MSRYEIIHKDRGLAFGYDHALGEYLQIWDETKGHGPDVDNILVDEDNQTGFTRDKMLRIIDAHGFKLSELVDAKMGRVDGSELAEWVFQRMERGK